MVMNGLKGKRNYFYVYQNKTFHEEYSGSYLWSPKYANGGRRHPGYETMKEVRPGDLIFHSYKGEIVAISIAQTRCYTHPRPSSSFSEWDNDGWKIDVTYHILPTSVSVSPYIADWYKIQPLNGPYTEAYRGKQQYLCNVNQELYECLIEKILQYQRSFREKDLIKTFIEDEIVDLPGDPSNPVDPTEIVLDEVTDCCKFDAIILEQNKRTTFEINIAKNPMQADKLGKRVGDVFSVPSVKLTYRIERIYKELM